MIIVQEKKKIKTICKIGHLRHNMGSIRKYPWTKFWRQVVAYITHQYKNKKPICFRCSVLYQKLFFPDEYL
jgi:hypothetical protein